MPQPPEIKAGQGLINVQIKSMLDSFKSVKAG